MKLQSFRFLCALALASAMSVSMAMSVASAAPGMIRYSGILLGANGVPYDGDVEVSVAIFGSASGGSALYTEDLGLQAAVGGELELPLGMAGSMELVDVMSMSDSLWLEFTIDGETLSPRQMIHSVPFALVAEQAQRIGALEAAQVASKTDLEGFILGKDQLPYDGLSTISNGTLTNHYKDILAQWTGGPQSLPDNTPAGINATIVPPEVPGAVLTALRLDMSVNVTIVSKVKLVLTAPSGEVFTLHDGTLIPGSYTYTHTLASTPALGALIGGDPSGTWTLNAADTDLTGPGPFASLMSFSILYDVIRPDTVLGTGDVDIAGDLNVMGDLTAGTLSGVGAVPAGAVMFFNLPACPAGWSDLASAQGRVLLGMPAGGALGATQGSPLSSGAMRTITDVPAHSHTIDPPTAGTSVAGGHSHCLNVSGADDNNHTGNFDGVADSDAGNKGCIRNTSVAGEHGHNIDIDAFSSAPTGSSAVDVTMPYLQLRVCVKN